MKINIFCSFLMLIIISCSQKNKIHDNSYLIKIDLNKSQEMDLGNLCSTIELIPLETTKESVIGKVSKICESKDYYYILDTKQDVLFRFSRDGKFVNSTKRNQGEGPGEYSSLTDFEINPYTGNIQILDARNLKIQTLNTDFTYKGSMPLGRELLPLSYFKIINKDTFVFPHKDNKEKDELVFFSIKNKRIIKETELPKTGNDLLKTVGYPFYTSNGQINYITKNCSNVLYHIDTAAFDINETLTIDFGKNNINIDKIPKRKTKDSYRSFIEGTGSKYAYLYDICEYDKYYIIYCNFQKKIFISKYDKNTNQVTTFYSEYGSTGQLAPPSVVRNKELICLIEPMYLKYYISSNLMNESSQMVLSHVKENDNPILIKYTLK